MRARLAANICMCLQLGRRKATRAVSIWPNAQEIPNPTMTTPRYFWRKNSMQIRKAIDEIPCKERTKLKNNFVQFKTSWGKTSWGKTSWGKTSWGKTSWGKTSWGKTSWGKTSWGICFDLLYFTRHVEPQSKGRIEMKETVTDWSWIIYSELCQLSESWLYSGWWPISHLWF